MPARSKPTAKVRSGASRPVVDGVREALAFFEQHASSKIRSAMAPRYGIHAERAFGVSVANIRALAKRLGRSHELATALWKTGWYEARMLSAFVDEPERVTPAQMDAWCRDFDNWAICDTLCFHLFDRTPHAPTKIEKWATAREEFVKRAAFALLASVALHHKTADDEALGAYLPLVENAATDERNFVKKAVSWALRSVGRRPSLRARAIEVANRLTASDDKTARWVGKDALRDFMRQAIKPTGSARRRALRKPPIEKRGGPFKPHR